MIEQRVRVRFAPSPTGALHIGGARTAYFNWLFARKSGGTFVLRIDDTDTSRSSEASYQQIIDSFRWLGLSWDEGPEIGGEFGPYRQSERLALYREELQRLLAEDKVYPCFCTQEQLLAEREKAQKDGRTPHYSGHCRQLTREQQEYELAAGKTAVYRLRAPKSGSTVVSDMIRGEVVFNNEEIDDFIVWKADGTPTYHFASCVDDYKMGITHIIRADEHLSNTPRHIAMFQALGAPIPQFAHIPMILAPDRSKLSKRHGATSVDEYRMAGILPEALINYLLLLGFSPGEDKELVEVEQAIELFDLRKVTKHAAIYDVKKLAWVNSHYIHSASPDYLLALVWEAWLGRHWTIANPNREQLAWLRSVIVVMQERSHNLQDLQDGVAYYFSAPMQYDVKGVRKHFTAPSTQEHLRRTADILQDAVPFTAHTIERVFRRFIAQQGLKGGELIHPTRLSLSGLTTGPGLFDMMAVLGRVECRQRLLAAADWIGQQVELKV
ncbi:glutamate--tRNA ligase [Alicyclobacillaceae bacterium I2511]|nr:glutamate--tRNA ligase [Alicyclobacillaceae bacterium I2511]